MNDEPIMKMFRGPQLVVMILALNNFSSAQVLVRDLNSVAALDSVQVIVAGKYGTLMRTTDGSGAWTPIQNPPASDVLCVDFRDSLDGFLVGSDGSVWRSTNAGNDWTNTGSVVVSTSTTRFSSAGAYMWITGPTGYLNRSSDSGTTWSSIRPRTTSGALISLSSVWFADTATGWGVGTKNVAKSTNAGETWTIQYTDQSNTNFHSVVFRDTLHGVVAGSIGSAIFFGSAGCILRTTDGGSSWSRDSIAQWGPFNQMVDSRSSDGGIILWAIASQRWILRSSDFGSSWQVSYHNDELSLRSLEFFGSQFGWCACGDGKVLETTDGGATWAVQELPIIRHKETSISGLRLWVDYDGIVGSLFRAMPSHEYPSFSGIEHLYGAGLWAGARRNDGSIAVSTAMEDVSSFRSPISEFASSREDVLAERSRLPASPYYSPTAVSDHDLCLQYTDTATYHYVNGAPGINQTPLGLKVRQEIYEWSDPSLSGVAIMHFTVTNISQNVLDSVHLGFYCDFVVRNIRQLSPSSGSLFFLHTAHGFVDSLRTIYAYDFDGYGQSSTTDSYVGLRLLGTTPSLASAGAGVSMNAWIFRNTSDPVLFSPSDDAARYDRLRHPFPDNVLSSIPRPANLMTLLSAGPFLSLAPGDSVQITYALAAAPKIGNQASYDDTPEQRSLLFARLNAAQQAYDDNFVVSADPTQGDLPGTFTLFQNYPNPFNPNTTITFGLPLESFVSLKIFDALGREVSMLASEELRAGTHTRQWNAAALPSGVYFYRLQAGSFTETKKLLLLR